MNQLDRFFDIPLPLIIKFNSVRLRFNELFENKENSYRNRKYLLKNFIGKQGFITLCDIELSSIKVVEENDVLNIEIENNDVIEKLEEAVTNGNLNLSGSAGQGLMKAEDIHKIKSGSIIALERSEGMSSTLIIPEIDYVLFQGETINIGDHLGLRIIDNDSYFRKDQVDKEIVTGEVILGSISIKPIDLNSYDIGTIVEFDSFCSPLFFILSDGTSFRGFLQYFTKEELLKQDSCVNKIQDSLDEMILTFRVTSVTGTEQQDNVNKTESPIKRTNKTIDSIFSTLSYSRLLFFLISVPPNVAIWVLKISNSKNSSQLLFDYCINFSEDKRVEIINMFISCNPFITPKTISKVIYNLFESIMDSEELAVLEECSQTKKDFPTVDRDKIVKAAEIINGLGEYEKQSIIKWFKTSNSDGYQLVDKYIFLFTDIAKLEDSNIQKLLRSIDIKDLVIALTGEDLDKTFTSVIERNMSSNACKLLHDDILNMNVSEKQRYTSRDTITGILRQLEDNGSIVV
jgi:flagellar motor switch protein FliG